MSTRKPQVKFTKKVKNFITQKMCEGLDISQICSKYPDKVPNRHSIYRKSVQDQDFADEINQAYTVLLMHRMDDLHKISGLTATEAYPNVEDWRQAEAALKRRIDEAKFILGKMAPILSKRFDKTQKVEVKGLESGPKLAVLNYYLETPPQLSDDSTITIDEKKDS